MITDVQTLPYGLPPRQGHMILGNNIHVPYMTLTELQYAIKQALSSCDSITLFEWNQDEFSYTIEYASRPIEETVPRELLGIVYRKKDVAYLAAYQASNLFPHNMEIDLNLDLDLDIVPLQLPKKWSQSILSIFWCLEYNCLCIEFRRLRADRVSSIEICNLIINHFNKINKIQTDLKNALVEAGEDIENTNLRDYLVRDVV